VRIDAADMLKRRLKQPGLPAHCSPHSFRATRITNFLENDGTLGAARRIAGHADRRITKLCDRRGQKVLLEDRERNAELGILQSIFRSASRRDRLENMGNGGRRDGGLKIDRTKPPAGAWPMCIGCRLDLWRSSEGRGSGQRWGLRSSSVWLRRAMTQLGGRHLPLGKSSE
jgi:hypothetical protein